MTAVGACYNGPIDAGEKVLDPVRRFGLPLDDQLQPLPYGFLQTIFDSSFLPGARYCWKAHLMGSVRQEAFEIMAEYYRRVPSPGTAVLFQQAGNAANRVPPEATAFSHRNARYDLVILSGWTDPADDDRNIAWTRELWDALAPYSLGAIYVNSVVDDDDATIQSAYRADTYRRLTELKARYDPTNFFKLNPNIKPAAR